jgi:hypothetical protein
MLPIPLMQAKIDVGELKLRNSTGGDALNFFLKGKQSQKDFLFLLLFYQDKCLKNARIQLNNS